MSRATDPALDRIEAEISADNLHRCIVVTRVVESEIAELVLNTKRANDVEYLCRDILPGMAVDQFRKAKDDFLWLILDVPEQCRDSI